MEDFERSGVYELQVCQELLVTSSSEFAYGDPTPDVFSFVSFMIYVSSYFLLYYFGIMYKVECCITTWVDVENDYMYCVIVLYSIEVLHTVVVLGVTRVLLTLSFLCLHT